MIPPKKKKKNCRKERAGVSTGSAALARVAAGTQALAPAAAPAAAAASAAASAPARPARVVVAVTAPATTPVASAAASAAASIAAVAPPSSSSSSSAAAVVTASSAPSTTEHKQGNRKRTSTAETAKEKRLGRRKVCLEIAKQIDFVLVKKVCEAMEGHQPRAYREGDFASPSIAPQNSSATSTSALPSGTR